MRHQFILTGRVRLVRCARLAVETDLHKVSALLSESLIHEKFALGLYHGLLKLATDHSVYLEEYARTQVSFLSSRASYHRNSSTALLRDSDVFDSCRSQQKSYTAWSSRRCSWITRRRSRVQSCERMPVRRMIGLL